MDRGRSRAALPIAVSVVVMVVWGATPVATRLATDTLEPIVVALGRTLLAGALALPLILACRFRPPRTKRHRHLLAASSASGFVGFPIIYTLGQERTSAMHGGIILAALPVIVGAYAALLDRRRPSRRWAAGCALALAGAVLVVALRASGGGSEATVAGDLLVGLSAAVVAIGYLAGARLGAEGYASLATTAYGVLIASFMLVVPVVVLIARDGPPRGSVSSWAAVAFLAAVTSILGYVGWYWALARGGVARISPFLFLQPISGIALAAAVLDERLTVPLGLGAAAIVAGVTLAQRA